MGKGEQSLKSENGGVSLPNQLPWRRYQKKRNLTHTALTWAGGSLRVFGQSQQPPEWWSSRGGLSSLAVWGAAPGSPGSWASRVPPSSSKTLPHQLPSESKAVGSAIKGPVLSTQLLPTAGSAAVVRPRGPFFCRLLASPLEFGSPLSLAKHLSLGE